MMFLSTSIHLIGPPKLKQTTCGTALKEIWINLTQMKSKSDGQDEQI
jgi:hypothetical protein